MFCSKEAGRSAIKRSTMLRGVWWENAQASSLRRVLKSLFRKIVSLRYSNGSYDRISLSLEINSSRHSVKDLSLLDEIVFLKRWRFHLTHYCICTLWHFKSFINRCGRLVQRKILSMQLIVLKYFYRSGKHDWMSVGTILILHLNLDPLIL